MDEQQIIDLIRDVVPFMDWQDWLNSSNWSWDLAFRSFGDGLILAAAGWLLATWLERRHMKRLAVREAAVSHIVVLPTPPVDTEKGTSDFLIGSASFCHDFFRSFLVFIRRLFGGHVGHYHRLVERARREALVRLKEEAAIRGVNHIYEVRVEENNLSLKLPRIEVMAYGTAILHE